MHFEPPTAYSSSQFYGGSGPVKYASRVRFYASVSWPVTITLKKKKEKKGGTTIFFENGKHINLNHREVKPPQI
jgi:hypothetical protein